MKKIIILILVMTISIISQSKNNPTGLDRLKTLSINVREEVKTGERRRDILVSEYNLMLELPSNMKKIQLSPEMNKGEIYLYNKGIKTTYLPFFNQKTTEPVGKNEKTILDYINEIKKISETDLEFTKNYTEKGSTTLKSGNNTKVIFKGIKKIDGIYIPTEIELYENSDRVARVIIKNIKINPKFEPKEFTI